MNCKSAESRLSAYVDSELSGREMLALKDHVSHCSSCRQELESIRSIKCLMGSFLQVEPPAGLEERIARAVRMRCEVPVPRVSMQRIQVAWPLAAGLIFGSMAVTIMIMEVAPARPAIKQSRKSVPIEFEVQRDQAYSAGTDPYMGAPVISASYGTR